MTTALALLYIPHRMEELNHGDQYHIRFRHFVLAGMEKIEIESGSQLYLLIEPVDAISVESSFGIFDVTASNLNELQYEHQGNIHISNHTTTVQHVRFVQIIPKN